MLVLYKLGTLIHILALQMSLCPGKPMDMSA